MTHEIKESLKKGFIREQYKQGGITPTLMKCGSSLLIETTELMYEVRADLTSYPTPRFILSTGSPVCNKLGTILLGIDSRNRKINFDMKDWIGKGVCLLLKFQNGTLVLTGPVVSVTLHGEGFKYELWS